MDEKVNRLLNDAQWPEAVSTELICDTRSEDNKLERANLIVSSIFGNSLNGKKFLDFGTGEGHVPRAASQQATTLSIGYDPFHNDEKVVNDFDTISNRAPYDYILLYDVLDHIKNESPAEVLSKVEGVCHADTQIVVVCHPWTSRHGGHFYNSINKAFIHLVFSNEELTELGYLPNEQTYTQQFNSFGYEHAFKTTGLDVVSKEYETDQVEEFFIRDEIRHSVTTRLGLEDPNGLQYCWLLRQSFIYYTLKPRCIRSHVNPIAVFRHSVSNHNTFDNILYGNGKIGTPDSENTWEMKNGRLILRYKNHSAPGGFWIDDCELSNDLQSYSGENQHRVKISGIMQ